MFQQLIETATRWRSPDRWLRDGNPWELEREAPGASAVRRPHRAVPTSRAAAPPLGRYPTCSPCPTTCPSPATATTRSTRCACGRAAATDEFRPRGVQRRQLHRCRRGQERRRADHHGALPQRRQRGRQGAAAAPAVLPRLGQPQDVLARVGAAARARLQRVCRQELLPAQRHAPGGGGAGADAPADGRARLDWDEAWASPPAPWPTPTTPCCRRPWSAGRCAVRAAAAAGAGDHLRDQRPLPVRGRRAGPATWSASGACR
jgi:hypothetical protein